MIRLAAVSLRVPSAADSAAFWCAALDFARTDELDGAVHLTATGAYGKPPPRRMLTLLPGGEGAPDLAELAFESDDLPGLRRRLVAAGVAVATLPSQGGAPDGMALTGAAGERIAVRTPASSDEGLLPPSPLRPRGLGHVNLSVPDAPAAAAFYADALGLSLSERVGQLLYFLRAGSDHHNVGVRGGGTRVGVHHVAFETIGWESYRVVCDHLAGLGHTVEYGPGRHGPGHNLFVYVRDPHSGLRLELFSDMAHIDDPDHEPVVWDTADRPRTVNQWGPAPPASFLD